jgi:hypothetical protein
MTDTLVGFNHSAIDVRRTIGKIVTARLSASGGHFARLADQNQQQLILRVEELEGRIYSVVVHIKRGEKFRETMIIEPVEMKIKGEDRASTVG